MKEGRKSLISLVVAKPHFMRANARRLGVAAQTSPCHVIQNRKRAAVRCTGLILSQASSAAKCSGRVAVL